MHQDQGDASHVRYSIRVRIWEIIHIRALGPRDREVNQQVKEASKVKTPTEYPVAKVTCGNSGRGWHRHTRRYNRRFSVYMSSLSPSLYHILWFSPPYLNNTWGSFLLAVASVVCLSSHFVHPSLRLRP